MRSSGSLLFNSVRSPADGESLRDSSNYVAESATVHCAEPPFVQAVPVANESFEDKISRFTSQLHHISQKATELLESSKINLSENSAFTKVTAALCHCTLSRLTEHAIFTVSLTTSCSPCLRNQF